MHQLFGQGARCAAALVGLCALVRFLVPADALAVRPAFLKGSTQ